MVDPVGRKRSDRETNQFRYRGKPQPVMSKAVLAAQDVGGESWSDSVIGYATTLFGRRVSVSLLLNLSGKRSQSRSRASINLVVAASSGSDQRSLSCRRGYSLCVFIRFSSPHYHKFHSSSKGLSSDDIITQIIEATCAWPIFLMRTTRQSLMQIALMPPLEEVAGLELVAQGASRSSNWLSSEFLSV